jgi:hypothetical protein
MADSQIWIGSIPGYMNEVQVVEYLRAHAVPVSKLILRTSPGKDCHYTE